MASIILGFPVKTADIQVHHTPFTVCIQYFKFWINVTEALMIHIKKNNDITDSFLLLVHYICLVCFCLCRCITALLELANLGHNRIKLHRSEFSTDAWILTDINTFRLNRSSSRRQNHMTQQMSRCLSEGSLTTGYYKCTIKESSAVKCRYPFFYELTDNSSWLKMSHPLCPPVPF